MDHDFNVLDKSSPFACGGGEVLPVFGGNSGLQQQLFQQQHHHHSSSSTDFLAPSACGAGQAGLVMLPLATTAAVEAAGGGCEGGFGSTAATAAACATTTTSTTTLYHDSSSMSFLPTLGSSTLTTNEQQTATAPVDVPGTSGGGSYWQNTTAAADLLYLSSSPLKPWLPGSFPEDMQQGVTSLAAAAAAGGSGEGRRTPRAAPGRHPRASPGDEDMLDTLEALGLRGLGLSPCGTPPLPLQLPTYTGSATAGALARQLGGTVNAAAGRVNPPPASLQYPSGLAPLTGPTPTPLGDAAAGSSLQQQQQGQLRQVMSAPSAAAGAGEVHTSNNGSPLASSSAASGAPQVNPGQLPVPAFNALADFDFDLDLLEQLCREQIAVDEETAALAALGGLGLATGASPTPPLPSALAAATPVAGSGFARTSPAAMASVGHPQQQQQQQMGGAFNSSTWGQQQPQVDCTALPPPLAVQDVYARSFAGTPPLSGQPQQQQLVNPGALALTGPAASTPRKQHQQRSQQQLLSAPSRSTSGCSGLEESHCEGAGGGGCKEPSTCNSTSSRVFACSSSSGGRQGPAGDRCRQGGGAGAMRVPDGCHQVTLGGLTGFTTTTSSSGMVHTGAQAQRLALLQQLVDQLLPMVDQGTASQLRGQLSQSAAGGNMAESLTAAVTLLQKLQQQHQAGGTAGNPGVTPGSDSPGGPAAAIDRRGSSNMDRIPSCSSLPSLGGGSGTAKGASGTVNSFGQPQPRRKMLVFQRQRSTTRTAFTPNTLRVSGGLGQPSEGGTAVSGGQRSSGALPSPGAASSTSSGGGGRKRGLGSLAASPRSAAKESNKRGPPAVAPAGAAAAAAPPAAAAGRGGSCGSLGEVGGAAAGGGGGAFARGPAAMGLSSAASGGAGGAIAQLPVEPTPAASAAAGGGYGIDKSSSSSALDESVAVQQAHALVKVLGRLTLDQLTACRPLLPQILAKSAPLLVPYCAAVHDMVGQCIAARQSNPGPTPGQTSPGAADQMMVQGLQQLAAAQLGATRGAADTGSFTGPGNSSLAPATNHPAAAAAGGGGQCRSDSPGGTIAAGQELEAPCMDYELATSMQFGRRQRRRCDSRATLCIQSTGQSCEAAGSNTALTSLCGGTSGQPYMDHCGAGAAEQPLLLTHQQQYGYPVSVDPCGPCDFMGMLMQDD